MPTLSTKRTMARANQSTTKRLRTVERAVRQNKAELKFKVGSGLSIGNPIDLTRFIVEGTGKDERIGDTINVKKVEVRMLGNRGVQRLRAALYTQEDGANPPPYTLGGNFVQFIDTNLLRLWDEDFERDRIDFVGADTININVPLPGRHVDLKKTWSIPMKVKYREGIDAPYHNEIEFQVVSENDTAQAIGPPANYGDFIYKIWYYDA